MSRTGVGQVVRPRTSGAAAFDGCQLYGGDVSAAGGGSTWVPFVFGNSGGDALALIDNGYINHSTHAVSGGYFGSFTVAADSSVVILKDGLYKIDATGRLSADPGIVEVYTLLGIDDTLASGYVGLDFYAEATSTGPAIHLSGSWTLSLTEGQVLYWAFVNVSATAAVQFNATTWTVEYKGPVPA